MSFADRRFKRRMRNLNTQIRRAERHNSGSGVPCGVVVLAGAGTAFWGCVEAGSRLLG